MNQSQKTDSNQSKLSAMKYIRNNKRRVSVLVVSLTLSCFMFYISSFFLSTTSETFKTLLIDGTKKVQYISLPGSSFDIEYDNITQYQKELEARHLELADKLKKEEGVKEVFYAQTDYLKLSTGIGEWNMEVILAEAENVSALMEHLDAKLIKGTIPENSNEIIMDERTGKNGNYKIGDTLQDYPELKIVGIASSDYYFACGIKDDSSEYISNGLLCILSDGSIEDITSLVRKYGYEFNENSTYYMDIKQGKIDYQEDVVESMSTSGNLIFSCVVSILSILLLIVYITYLRDRRNEWCLYCSIGFSRKEIYRLVIRELLFTFLFSAVLGAVIVALSVVGLDYTYVSALGLRCRYLYSDVIFEILCAYVLIFGILQIPIRYAIYKIRTIDAMDDDLL